MSSGRTPTVNPWNGSACSLSCLVQACIPVWCRMGSWCPYSQVWPCSSSGVGQAVWRSRWSCNSPLMYILFNKNQVAWYFVHPAQAVTWRTVAIIISVVLLSPYLCIRGMSLSSIHYNQSCHIYINPRPIHSLNMKLKHEWMVINFPRHVAY